MKKVIKYVIVVFLFVVIMLILFKYYINEKDKYKLISNASKMVEDISSFGEGNYTFENGYINDKYYFDGNGTVNIDKYGNVKFGITVVNKCVYKNYAGNIKVSSSCPKEKNIEVEIIKNNKTISFVSNDNQLDYKVSSEDDYKGQWYSPKGSNVVLSSYSSGDNYIWFKDKDGNLSKPYMFKVDCFDGDGLEYEDNLFYCIGSIVKLDDIEWIVISSKKDENVLMKKENFDDRYAMCDKKESSFCYYTKNSKSSYKWSDSIVYNYLNNEFINTLSENTRSKLKDNYICDDYTYKGCSNNMGCAGYIKEYINKEEYTCSKYMTSKVRIITYEEYNKVYKNNKNLDSFIGNYWILNSYKEDTVGSIEEVGNVYMYENPIYKRDVRPVITLSK